MFIIRIFVWSIPSDHEIYNTYNRSVKNITLSNLMKVTLSYNLFQGIISDNGKKNSVQHHIRLLFNPLNNDPVQQNTYNRCMQYKVLVKDLSACSDCTKLENLLYSQSKKVTKRKEKAISYPV